MNPGRRLTDVPALAAAAVALRLAQPPLPRTPGALRPWLAHTSADQVVVTAAAAAAWLCLAWLALGAALVLGSRAPGAAGDAAAALSRRLTPPTVRHLLEAALGVAVAAGTVVPALPAVADPGSRTSVTSLDRPVGIAPDAAAPASPAPASSSLDRPVAPSVPVAPARVSLVAAAPRAEHALDGEVVVRPGDTLWDLAARRLGPGAGVVEIAAAWPEWYAANRAVIGANPDLIKPGQRLRPPR